jgi:hypothetical protein
MKTLYNDEAHLLDDFSIEPVMLMTLGVLEVLLSLLVQISLLRTQRFIFHDVVHFTIQNGPTKTNTVHTSGTMRWKKIACLIYPNCMSHIYNLDKKKENIQFASYLSSNAFSFMSN